MLTLNISPFPELQTERLILRAVKQTDVHEVFTLRSDKETMRYIAKPLMKTLSDAEAHIKIIEEGIKKKEHINWAITLKGEDKLIGILGFYRMALEHHRSEVGYMLLKQYHRKGIMNEALNAVIDYGFNKIKFHQIEAIIDNNNAASEGILIKNKFVKEAHFKENYLFGGKYLDSVHYTILAKNR
ncbi:MAG TPA: GNAT family N-acetyltransferase [Bacteroidia bacterium]|jgi:ribosomal-protein-alanine N-acetyltransferase|nr:GNAT family N-acetyltransferase [Bacteroidia bacterium]